MDIYILKFSACLAVFMLFYKLVLERESVHQFKRFYLLATLAVSAGIPFITFTTFVETAPVLNAVVFTNSESVAAPTEIAPTFADYLPTILWSVYALGVIIFMGRFTINLVQLIKRIKQNPKYKKGNLVYVLMTDLVYPHTFLHYIFLNKVKYETYDIPREVMLHEETHAKQKHALDIIFIELLQIIFWFNPLLYFIKKDIKLNHEFLADQAVLEQGTDTKTYQHILLAFSASGNKEDAQTHHLANAINYSLIKKRFTVMKSHTSNTVKWVKGLIILPVLAVLIYSFSTTKEVYQPAEPKISPNNLTLKVLEKQTKTLLKINGIVCEICEFSLTKSELENIKIETNTTETISSFKFKVPGKPTINVLGNALNEEALTNLNSAKVGDYITIYDIKASKNSIKTPILIELVDNLIPPPPPPVPATATPEQKEKYKKVQGDYNRKHKVKRGEVSNIPPPPPPVPENATPEQKAKYKDVSSEYYKKYKIEDGKVSERLPPPPPPPIPENATREQQEKYKQVQDDYNQKYKIKKGEVSNIPPPPPPPPPAPKTMAVGKKIDQAYYDSLETVTNNKTNKEKNPWGITTVATNEQSDSTTPENPPVPTEHMKQLNNEGASFSYNGKNITGEEAIKLTQVNSNLHIYVSKSTDTQKAIVKINDRLEGTATSEEIQRSIKNKEISAAYAKEHPEKVTQKKSESGETIQIVEVPADLLDSETPKSAYDFVKSLKDDDIRYFYNDKQVSYNDILEITKKEPHINVSTKITDDKGTVHFTSVK